MKIRESRRGVVVFLVVVLLVAWVSFARADRAGFLTYRDGDAVTGMVLPMRLRIFDAVNGVEILHEEERVVAVKQGGCAISLPTSVKIDGCGWFEIEIDGDTLVPRFTVTDLSNTFFLSGEVYLLDLSPVARQDSRMADPASIIISDTVDFNTTLDMGSQGIRLGGVTRFSWPSGDPADDFLQSEVDNLRAAKLDDGSTPWTNAANITAGTLSNYRLDTDLQDLALDSVLSSTRVQYGSYFIRSAGSSGLVWKSDGLDYGYWGTDLTGGTGGDSDWTISGSDMYAGVSGNVGIGNTSPVHKISVSSNISNSAGTDGSFIDLANSNDASGVMAGIRFQNGSAFNVHKGAIFYRDNATYGRGDLIFANRNTASSDNVTAGDARLTIKNTGNVGIGTTTPAYLLDVAGDMAFSGTLQGGTVPVARISGLAADDFTQTEVDNLRAAKLDDGTKPWIDASNITAGTLSSAWVQYGDYFINSAGSSGQVWKSDGSGRGIWGTDNTGSGASVAFRYIDVPSGTNPDADIASDTLYFYQGGIVTITGSSSDWITISATEVDGSTTNEIPVAGNDIDVSSRTVSLESILDNVDRINFSHGDWGIRFDTDDTRIYAGTLDPECLFISADDDIYLQPDDDLIIQPGDDIYVEMSASGRGVGIGTLPDTASKLHVKEDSSSNKYVIRGEAMSLSYSDPQNVGVYGYARGLQDNYGFAAGVMGIGDYDNSWYAIGVYAGLNNGPLTILESVDTALYADGNNKGAAGFFVNGNVGIGTTSFNSSTSGLQIKPAARYRWGLLLTDTDGSEAVALGIDGSGDGYVSICDGSGTEKIFLDADDTSSFQGSLSVYGTLYAASCTGCASDRSMKEAISPLDHALAKVMQLRGVEFDWKEEYREGMNMPEGRQIGMIAQEVEEVLPTLVCTNEKGGKAVKYALLTALLVESVKEQQTAITLLKKENEGLRAMIMALAEK